jgi:uncharacterized protein with FMN-binding domain
MRRICAAAASTVVGLIMLFSYRTSTMGAGGGATPAPVTSTTGPGTAGGTGTTAGTRTTAGGTSAGGAAAGGAAQAVDGSAVSTKWGTVQVRITVQGGKVVDVTTLSLPDSNGRDLRINGSAVPVLRQEALAAQGAHIDTVSGATITSHGYITSLQAALDAAHLGG